MIYNNNKSLFDEEQFKKPSKEYRGAPFWAWNCKLNKDELLRQIECLKEMGFGGFYMHSRSGMDTEYLGKDFMELVKACVDKAEDEDMLAWLYDEDRWPSGAAGGYLTKNKKFRQKIIEFRPDRIEAVDFEEGYAEGKPYLLACYDVKLNNDGTLREYSKTAENDKADGKRWYAYVKTTEERGWFNGQAYADTMCDEAMAEFAKITYNAYEKSVGDRFGRTIHAIFTDEPEYARKMTLPFALKENVAILPWTTDFNESFMEEYDFDILEFLPEIIWDLPDRKPSKARYYYHDHCCERFTKAFSDQLGNWCKEHNIALTGHMMGEPTLIGQTSMIGDAMRAYRSFGVPGIDMLCDLREYNTAKQAQSMKNQCGAEAMVSELYGVTGWDFDFRGYKLAGDWQAALGVTLRVPHLSWVSMKGAAKRDYPASFNYQAPWYKKFPVIEDHFARLNTVLTRGKQCVKLAVVHPIESAWLNFGPGDTSKDIMQELDDNFKNLTDWLLFGMIDFDFICESMLPKQYKSSAKGLNVGEMCYDTVLVPPVKTMRKTTLDILCDFFGRGGKIIFAGACPDVVDAQKSNAVSDLYNKCIHTDFTKMAILSQLDDIRDVEIRNSSGALTDNLIYNMREDGDCKYLFIANGRREMKDEKLTYLPRKERLRPFYKDVVDVNDVIIKITGEYCPVLMDTLTGECSEVAFETKDGFTYIPYSFYAHDSVLLKLVDGKKAHSCNESKYEEIKRIDFRKPVKYVMHEPNVLVLDTAQYALDDEPLNESEGILRIDDIIRGRLGLERADGCQAQPWVFGEKPPQNTVTLKFEVCSEIECEAELAYEEMVYLNINGIELEVKDEGYYVDKSIHKMKIPMLKRGINEIIVKTPIGERVSVENYYLLGDFGVRVNGCQSIIQKKNDKITFGTITNQGMPFYGGNVTYIIEFETNNDAVAEIEATYFRGDLIGVTLDGENIGDIIIMPYSIRLPKLKKGKHTLEFTLYGNRFNTFGALHNCGDNDWPGPEIWYTKDSEWCYEYNVKETGILKSPVIRMLEEKKI